MHVMSDEESSSVSSDDDDTEQYQAYNWRAERLLREEFITVCIYFCLNLHTYKHQIILHTMQQ